MFGSVVIRLLVKAWRAGPWAAGGSQLSGHFRSPRNHTIQSNLLIFHTSPLPHLPSATRLAIPPFLLDSSKGAAYATAMAPDLNSITTAGAASATSGHQQAQNTHLATSQQQPTSRSSTSRNTSNRSSPNHSRRTSQLSSMNPPPLPLGHSNSTAQQHQNQQTYAPFPPLSPHMSAAGPAPNGRARAGSSAGAEMEAGVPMRHPRPLTAAELHHELELEQEAVVSGGSFCFNFPSRNQISKELSTNSQVSAN